MKTLTELGGSLIRTAAAAIAEARRSLPREERPAEPPATEAAPRAAEAAPPAEVPRAVEASEAAEVPQATDGSVADPAIETVAEAAPPAPPAAVPKPEPEVESEAVKAALLDAVARATGLSGDRLVMLRAAVEAAGRRAEDVRLVRVFGIEEQLRGAQKIGEYQYVVDFLPRSMKQVAGGPDEHGRGGGRRGPGRGGGGGGGRGAKGSVSGGFSMDSLRDDKKGERGGRGRPGGGATGGGPGKPTGGGPKK
jgi:hypothetical protein